VGGEEMTVRAQLLAALADGPATTPDLAAVTGRDRAVVWHTLRKMQRAGLVQFHRFWSQQTTAVAWRLRRQ
jgi:predicted transcriptional regulator